MTQSKFPSAPSAAPLAPDRPSALAKYTPAEVALLYADRVLPSRPDPFLGGYRIPPSGRYVDDGAAATLMVETMLGALLASGDVQLTDRPRKGFFFKSTVAHVRLAQNPTRWRTGSPEGALVAWLAAEPQREAWLDDAFRIVTIPTTSPSPERVACDHALARLEQTGILFPTLRRVWRLFKVREYDVVARHRPTLLGVPDDEVRAAIACRTHGALDQRPTLRKAWRHARSMRLEDAGQT